MTGGRQSDYSLSVDGEPGTYLSLVDGEYRFSGGTSVSGSTLVVRGTLVSDVFLTNAAFHPPGTLWLSGTVRGNVENNHMLSTRHVCGTGLNLCIDDPHSRIEGNYTQAWSGGLELVLGWPLHITGTASLDGTLILIGGTSRSYVLPGPASGVLLLAAAGGVSGQFTGWTAPTLFIEGTLRYTGDSVYIDITRISAAAAMSAAGSQGHALRIASSLDRSFAVADAYARHHTGSLDQAQRNFLRSASRIQHIGDVRQAERTLDSLGGGVHALATDAVRRRPALGASRLDARLVRSAPGLAAVSWTTTADGGVAAGHEAWIDGNWLLGTTVQSDRFVLRPSAAAGMVDGEWAAADVHAHFRSDDGRWFATAGTGFGHANLDIRRNIDLGDGSPRLVHARRAVVQAYGYAETGRRVPLQRGQLSPFLGVQAVSSRSGAFTEAGPTGFELVASSATEAELRATAGARYAHDWRPGSGNWLRLDIEARYDHRAWASGTPQKLAFAGTPGAVFPLLAAEREACGSRIGFRASGGLGRGWTWSLDHARETGHAAAESSWALGLTRAF